MAMSRSIAPDLRSGVELVRFLSALTLVTGLGPLVAPQIGSWVLAATSWQGVFISLAGFGLALLLTAWWRLPETLSDDRRSDGGTWSSLVAIGRLTRDGPFMRLALVCGFGLSGVLVYAAGSTFVLQNHYGLSPQVYGIVFALGACGYTRNRRPLAAGRPRELIKAL
jgi:MFS transporter, DHA1 family, multidrug resistance protein